MHVPANDKGAYLGGAGTVGSGYVEFTKEYPPDNKHLTYLDPMIRYSY